MRTILPRQHHLRLEAGRSCTLDPVSTVVLVGAFTVLGPLLTVLSAIDGDWRGAGLFPAAVALTVLLKRLR